MPGSKAIQADQTAPAARALLGEHPLTVRLRSLIARIAASGATVLITGESGTGKEVVARAIHAGSPRRDRAFVPVNCAAIPHEMLESEMFGHERGAFTGAVGARQGLFAMAEGGTIFLDEISEMPTQLQAKLLRVLEDRVIRPLGSDRTSRVDARVIAASNRDLGAAVKQGTFREDLFYRLQVVPLSIPPLRERRSDIAILAQHFLERVHERYPGRNLTISRDAMVHLWSYDWPGNVRELENMIERMSLLCEGPEIDVSILPPNIAASTRLAAVPALSQPDGATDFITVVRQFEGRLVNEALRRTGGNKQAAAKLLGLKRTTFTAKLRRVGVVDSAR
jgi:two-component system response regulator AtoC